MKNNNGQYIWEMLRMGLGGILLWSFFDKVYGLGFSTPPEKAWLAGVSPTYGFLKFGTKGFFASFFQNLAGNPTVDRLFMLGLLLVGSSLILGIGMKIASYSGALIMFLIWLAVFPPEHNPILDDHLIYILVFFGLKDNAGYRWGLRKRWANTSTVKKYPFLE